MKDEPSEEVRKRIAEMKARPPLSEYVKVRLEKIKRH